MSRPGRPTRWAWRGNNALGFYKLNFQLTAAPSGSSSAVNWGTVEQKQFANQQVGGVRNQFAITAARDGILTIQAGFNHAAGNVDFQVYNSAGQLLGSSASLTNQERIDITVRAGETVYLRAVGQNNDVDFTVTNLVQVSGNIVTINGTTGSDAFTFAAGANNVATVNGVSYSWAAGQRTFNFVGRGGADSATFTGGAGNDAATFRPGSVSLVGSGYAANASGVGNIVVNGGGGVNSAVFFDSTGADTFIASPTQSQMTGAGFNNTARGFGTVQATSSGGADRATLYDSAGNDTLIGRATETRLSGTGFSITVGKFGYVQVVASGGYDSATFYDSAGNDTFVGSVSQSQMSGSGYSIVANNFERTRVYGTTGVNQATFTAPAGATVTNRHNLFHAIGGGSDILIYNFGTARVQTATVTAAGTRSLSVTPGLGTSSVSAVSSWSTAQQTAFAQWAKELQQQSNWNFSNNPAGEAAALDAFFRRLGR